MKQPLSLLLLILLGCSSDPGGPSGGSLRVTIIGLPGNSSAAVTVSGPGGFSQAVTGTQTIPGLAAGTYTVSASNVTVGTSDYSPSPVSQTVAVNSSQSSASVAYSTAGGNLTVTINGLGSASTAAVTVTGPGGYSRPVPATTTLTGLTPGDYMVSARDTIASGGTPHTASPPSQNVTVPARATGNATVTYTPPSGGSLNLQIAGLYITQSTQTYPAAVPLVANRDGYLRVFVVANRTTNSAEVPSVRVRYYSAGIPVDSSLILNPQTLSVPTTVDESSLSYSWNVPVPGSLIRTGLSIQAEVNPGGTVLEGDYTDNVFTVAAGQPATDVRSLPALNVTFVPIVQSGLTGDVSDANKAAFLDMTKRMHPIDVIDAVVGQPFPTTWTLNSDGSGWAELLGDFDAAMVADGRYYYGVVKVPYTSGVAGVAYVSNGSVSAHAALGWDHQTNNSASVVAAHELAHNWGRSHAPCGNPLPLQLDPSYPQPDGSIGSYGLDLTTSTLKPRTLSDIMGYCSVKWIGDYNYKGVMNYRIAHPLVMGATPQPVQPALLVWGHIRAGEVVLEPAFQVNTRPRLPANPGPYSVEARAEDGSSLFTLSFTPNEIADAGASQQNFAFAVPLSAAKAARLSSLRLAGRGREVVLQARAGTQPDSVAVRRLGSSRVGLRWNARSHPMVMIRDAETGQVLSFARGGDAQIVTSKGQVDLVFSDGVKSRIRRVQVPR